MDAPHPAGAESSRIAKLHRLEESLGAIELQPGTAELGAINARLSRRIAIDAALPETAVKMAGL